jgi:hypothetical protein
MSVIRTSIIHFDLLDLVVDVWSEFKDMQQYTVYVFEDLKIEKGSADPFPSPLNPPIWYICIVRGYCKGGNLYYCEMSTYFSNVGSHIS